MRLGEPPASWRSQFALFRATAVEFSVRLVAFQSMEGWGGLVAFFVTAEAVGKLSFLAWLSAVGVLLLWFAAINMLPVPPFVGFHVLEAFGRWSTGRRLPEGLRNRLALLCVLAVVVFFSRALWIDVVWLWRESVG